MHLHFLQLPLQYLYGQPRSWSDSGDFSNLVILTPWPKKIPKSAIFYFSELPKRLGIGLGTCRIIWRKKERKQNSSNLLATPLIIFIWLAMILEQFGCFNKFLDVDPLAKTKNLNLPFLLFGAAKKATYRFWHVPKVVC